MATNEKARDRGNIRADRLMTTLSVELREARHSAGVSQAHVARVAGLEQSRISRTERHRWPAPRLDELARHCAALGLSLSARTYPEGSPVRDAGQLRLLARLRAIVHESFAWRSEVPVGGYGDLRAWDVVLDAGTKIGIDAETRLHDIQDLQRRVELKWRDSGLPRLVLVVASTRNNRSVLRQHRAALASTFPLGSRAVLAALREGRTPEANGIVLI